MERFNIDMRLRLSDPGRMWNLAVPDRSSLGLLIAVSLAVIASQALLWPHMTDDAYICFRYVDRLASGDGLTFNPGEKTEGFSNPLWVFILALLKRSFPRLETQDTARFLGLVFTLASTIVLWRLNNRGQAPDPARRTFMLAAAMLLTTPGLYYYATAGLEGPLLMLLITCGVSATLGAGRQDLLLAAAAFGLAAVTRPEGALYGILWFVSTLPRMPSRGYHRLPGAELLRLSVFLTPPFAYQAFRVIYFDAWVPTTFLAKSPGTFGHLFGIPYLVPWVIAAGVPAVVVVCLFRWRPCEFGLKLFRASLGPMLACAVFVVYAKGDWMLFGRFVLPLWPVAVLLICVWLNRFMDHQPRLAVLKWRGDANILFLILVISLAAATAWRTPLTDYVNNRGMAAMLMRGHDQMAVGRWLAENVNDGATLVTLRLGGISYGAPDLVVWDLGGLTDLEEARYLRRGTLYPLESHPAFRRDPDVVAHVLFPRWGYGNTGDFSCWLLERYLFLKSFAQGNFGSVDIWVSRRAAGKVLRHPPGTVDIPGDLVDSVQCE